MNWLIRLVKLKDYLNAKIGFESCIQGLKLLSLVSSLVGSGEDGLD